MGGEGEGVHAGRADHCADDGVPGSPPGPPPGDLDRAADGPSVAFGGCTRLRNPAVDLMSWGERAIFLCWH
jgi:hypothetical protein